MSNKENLNATAEILLLKIASKLEHEDQTQELEFLRGLKTYSAKDVIKLENELKENLANSIEDDHSHDEELEFLRNLKTYDPKESKELEAGLSKVLSKL